MTFEETGLNPLLLKAVTELGFTQPTPIQEQAIPNILASQRDLVALAQTGTGKTAAFGLPILHQTDLQSRTVQSLILCPTRELCLQISKDLESYAKYSPGLKIVAVYGGTDIMKQIRAIDRGAQIVVGTPGRSLDLIRRKVLQVSGIRHLVLDEADEMLNMGFQEDLDAILAGTPEDKQTLLFSATMPGEISRIAKKYMHDPAEISIGQRNAGASNVAHEFYMVQARDRYEALKRIADINPKIYGIVFCRTKRETQEIARKLSADNYNADAIHGDLSQAQRDDVMERFRAGEVQLLVATDVAARGIDVDDLSHVINYELPDDLEVYVHRSGRTGRAGKRGVAISIIHTREMRKISALERTVGKAFERKKVPTGREICEKQLFNLVDKVEQVEVDESQIESYLDVVYKKLGWMSREDLIKRFLSVEFNQFLAYYKGARDLNVAVPESKSRRPERRDQQDRSDWQRRDRDRQDRPDWRERAEKQDRPVRQERTERPARPERPERIASPERDAQVPFSEREAKSPFIERESKTPLERESRPPVLDRDSGMLYSRYYINLGLKHDLNPGRLMGLINERLRNRKVPIGKIEILKKFSFFEIESSFERDMKKAFQDVVFEGIPVVIELSRPESNLPPAKTKKPSKMKKVSFDKSGNIVQKKPRHKKRDL